MLAEVVGAEDVQKARAIVVLSVTRTSRRRARLLARSMHLRIPTAQVILAALAGPQSDSPAAMLRGIRYVRTVCELLDALGMTKPGGPAGAAPAPGESKANSKTDAPP